MTSQPPTSSKELRELPTGRERPRRIKPGTSEYSAIHYWAKKNLEDPKKCLDCGATDRRLHWANVSGQYLKEASDWRRLCPSCHSVYDTRGTQCKNGHKLTDENAHQAPAHRGNHVRCWECNRENARKWRASHLEQEKQRVRDWKAKQRKERLARSNHA